MFGITEKCFNGSPTMRTIFPPLVGNGELDTVVSSRGKSKGCLANFVERQTRFYVAIKIENRSASEMYRAISDL